MKQDYEEQKYGAAHDNPPLEYWGTWVASEYEKDIFGRITWRRIGRQRYPLTCSYIIYFFCFLVITSSLCYFIYLSFYNAVNLK